MTESEARSAIAAYFDTARKSPPEELLRRARASLVDQVELESDGLHCRRIDAVYSIAEGGVRIEATVEEAGIPLLRDPVVETVRIS